MGSKKVGKKGVGSVYEMAAVAISGAQQAGRKTQKCAMRTKTMCMQCACVCGKKAEERERKREESVVGWNPEWRGEEEGDRERH